MKILVFAYACEPDKGSEPGAGWMWARILARFGEVWIITRANNRDSIERAARDLPETSNLHFVFVDLPRRARAWKRGQRGIRLYYLLWQLAALRKARSLHTEQQFDLVWHVTLATAWLGSVAPFVGPPCVLGPVGGGVGIRWRLLPLLGVRNSVYELARSVVRTLGRYMNPLTRAGWRRAVLILAQNPETRLWLPRRHQSKARVFSNAALEELPDVRHSSDRRSPPVALFAGRLLGWKGAELAVRAIALDPDWRLVICGDGPDRPRLEKLIKRLDLDNRVEILGWQPRQTVWRLMKEQADVFFFPSLHDEGSYAVAEAICHGLPVVCLAIGGPGWMTRRSGTAISPRGTGRAVVNRLAHEGLGGPHVSPQPLERERLSLDGRAEQLEAILRADGLLGTPDKGAQA